ncbi:MAG: nucleotidyltransferase family protein [Bacteroidales bacterium]|nr:nucleotidyltransferase family protein [Bacteroidales bacterium]
MEAIILAGGLGTRLRSVVSDRPKCMAEVEGKPFLYYWLRLLERYGVSKVIFSLGYKAESITKWCDGIRKDFPFSMEYKTEPEPLGTGGAIKYSLTASSDNEVLIINGDSLFLLDIRDLERKYNSCKASAVLGLKPMKDFSRYGNVTINKENKIINFEEKKFCSEGLINCGVYIVNKEKLNLDAFPEKFSFEKEVLEKRKDIYGFVYDDYFIDIGIPEDYMKAQKELPLLFD